MVYGCKRSKVHFDACCGQGLVQVVVVYIVAERGYRQCYCGTLWDTPPHNTPAKLAGGLCTPRNEGTDFRGQKNGLKRWGNGVGGGGGERN